MTTKTIVIGAFITVFAFGCSGDDEITVRDSVAAVTTVDGSVRATFVPGAPPSDGAGPALEVVTNPAVIPGGTTPMALSASAPVSTAIIAVDGFGGFYRIDLPDPAATVELLITLTQGLPAGGLDLIAGVGSGGSFGYVTTPVSVVPVGVGDVQVSLSWSTPADVDLHVIDPNGEEIYWIDRQSSSGGELDLDSNAGCGSDGPRNENITWPAGAAPLGTYRVAVDYWSNCGADETPFTVTVNTVDSAPLTFSGLFTGPGDMGGPGAGEEIATFSTGASSRRELHSSIRAFEVDVAPGAAIYLK